MRGRRACAAEAVLLAASAPGRALANGGGAVYVHRGGGAGAIVPRGVPDVRLVREDLSIDLSGAAGRLDDAWLPWPPTGAYDVHARYVLANPGPLREVLYAVPIFAPVLPPSGSWGPDVERLGTSAEEIASTISIAVGGKRQGCKFEPQTELLEPGAPFSGEVELGRARLKLAGFCAATIAIPPGSVELTLDYAGELAATDVTPPLPPECQAFGVQACERPPRETRGWYLHYPMGPASGWAGTPDQVTVAVSLGDFERRGSEGVPATAVEGDRTLRWTWEKPNLAGMQFVLQVEPSAAVENARLRTLNGRQDPDLCTPDLARAKVRASSRVARGGTRFDPKNVLDGKGSTAWCVDTRPGGVGEWIEIELPLGADGFRPRALHLLPGLARSQEDFLAAGRVSAVRLGPCGKRAEWRAELALDDDVRQSVVEVPNAREALADARVRRGKRACLRLEIAGAKTGASLPQVCISEVVLVTRCR